MSNPVNFVNIRGDFPEGQRGAFEGLVCQLAKREALDPKTFRRIEGAGGDGGVECIHRLPSGGIVGYQAKYHTKQEDIDWRKIDESVNTVLKTYPDLVTYVVAIACDFTGRRKVKGGKIGNGTWGVWDTHVEKWNSEATESGRTVEFIPWPAAELSDRLTPTEADGLRRLWFSEVEFSRDWFRRHVELASDALIERYHPKDHVNVTAQTLFEFIIRHPASRQKLSARIEQIKKFSIDGLFHGKSGVIPPKKLSGSLADVIQKLLICEQEFVLPAWVPWEPEKWVALAQDVSNNVNELQQWSWETREQFHDDAHKQVRHDLSNISDKLNKLADELDQLESLLKGRHLAAEKVRTALVVGRAGSGKSHLLARAAELAVSENLPVIFVLGQQLRHGALWPQILERLGFPGVPADEFLGALDAAAESARVRGLILIDAINEGAGARLWRNEISQFLAQIGRYPNLACVIACRAEYVKYVVPQAVLRALPHFEVRGFETPEEQEMAAKVYLDGRGITRPATPWLSPEFVNPLFLRSCCTALHNNGTSEFPRGLRGAKAIFAFFVDSVGCHLGVGRDGSNDLVGPTKATLREIAVQMAESRRDYLERNRADVIAVEKFSGFAPPFETSWLEVLQRNGLVRFDPDPAVDSADPLCEPGDVVRFSFQRFQDHLMAEALLRKVDDIQAAFAEGGPLAFIINKNRFGWGEWQGLVDALSSQIPERFGVELVDVPPDIDDNWWSRIWGTQDAFVESVRWRASEAFTDRTGQLLNQLFDGNHDPISLLIEVSASQDHPWNAEMIHRNLRQRKMPERDAFWTVEINKAFGDETHAIHRLIDWCLHGQGPLANQEAQRLCGLVLTWCFTSTCLPLRDKATKALTSVLVARPSIFFNLLDSFHEVDDLYVAERLFAAAYGASCIDPSPERIASYASRTARAVFLGKVPSENLLLRDYARGIVELAKHIGVLSDGIDIEQCRPPYGSPAPRFGVTDESLQQVADKAGGPEIMHSCYGWTGNFGKYEISPMVNSFVAVRLSKPPAYSAHEIFCQFVSEVIGKNSGRNEALEALQEAKRLDLNIIFEKFDTNRTSRTETVDPGVEIRRAELRLLGLLTPGEKKRYRAEARPWLGINPKDKKTDPKQFDIAAVQRWIAKRAYGLGWTKKMFPYEMEQHHDYSRSRPIVERIGKKYQWIALNELLCRLGDNYWIGGTHGKSAKRYDTPPDIGFMRDIDPTVLCCSKNSGGGALDNNPWMLGQQIIMPECPEDELNDWPFLADPGDGLVDLIQRIDPNGDKWITLYDHRRVSTQYAEKACTMEHGFRLEEFRFVYCVLVQHKDANRFVSNLKGKRKIDVHDWYPPELTDGPYLLEAPWRPTWPQSRWRTDGWQTPEDLPIAFPVSKYTWESHLDASLPEGASAFLPSPWLAHQLGLSPVPTDVSVYRDAAGKHQFIGTQLEHDGSSAVINAEIFEKYLAQQEIACVWLFVAERNAWPGGHNNTATWRRTEGVCWLEEGRKPNAVVWHEDRDNSTPKVS
ncbi:MAG: hypothetical protein A2521_04905 [Deltaproteobacteria bacterium RIFOXYD12_FULL_57_12]|nr:MAG: hypothetical protein A2521_04905 [Deltaproteobacteria bacterium RIFOXYD12_FULL_57_12]